MVTLVVSSCVWVLSALPPLILKDFTICAHGKRTL